MARRSSRRRTSRRRLEIRAARKGTVILAAILWIAGLFGYVGFYPLPAGLSVGMLAVAGGLLLLGAVTAAF